jgi:hypothetical protein
VLFAFSPVFLSTLCIFNPHVACTSIEVKDREWHNTLCTRLHRRLSKLSKLDFALQLSHHERCLLNSSKRNFSAANAMRFISKSKSINAKLPSLPPRNAFSVPDRRFLFPSRSLFYFIPSTSLILILLTAEVQAVLCS